MKGRGCMGPRLQLKAEGWKRELTVPTRRIARRSSLYPVGRPRFWLPTILCRTRPSHRSRPDAATSSTVWQLWAGLQERAVPVGWARCPSFTPDARFRAEEPGAA